MSATKYVVMTGGTMSGLGKGTSMSSLGVLLKSNNISLTCIKIDPYLNVDAGTMSPYEHGEVYVLNDGGEVDLDLGNYERFLNLTLSSDHNITTGKIYENVISRERKGEYLGKTVQVVPMITDLIQEWILKVSQKSVDQEPWKKPQVCLIEVGGTIGDIESAVYLEALQQFRTHVGPDNFCLCHLSYVPTIGSGGEQKTKPTQHNVRTLREVGLFPDIIFCRCTEPLRESSIQKIAIFSQVKPECVISVTNCDNLYKVPLLLDKQNVAQLICKKLKIDLSSDDSSNNFSLDTWKKLAHRYEFATEIVKVGIVGKYTGMIDSYLSVINALRHSAMECNLKLQLVWIDSTHLESETSEAWKLIKSVDGILCPGGFGDRGINGKCLAARYCRHNKVPYFGICMGLQCAVIDLYREFIDPEGTSEEFVPNSKTEDRDNSKSQDNATKFVVISMPEFIGDEKKGGTMRLGRRATLIKDTSSLAFAVYDNQSIIYERHRHRYEVNPQMVQNLESLGLKFVGTDETGSRMEICELADHPFFFCVQFHPEFNSQPLSPSPCFLAFVLSCKGLLRDRLNTGGGRLKPGKDYFN